MVTFSSLDYITKKISKQLQLKLNFPRVLAFTKKKGVKMTIKKVSINPLKAELNTICHFLSLLGAHLILHVSRVRFK